MVDYFNLAPTKVVLAGLDADGAVEIIRSDGEALFVIGPDGVAINGGMKVADVYAAARDIFVDWIFGADDTYQTLVAAAEAEGLWVEISTLNPNARQIVICVEATSGIDYDYEVEFSRNAAGDDAYVVASDTTVTAQITPIILTPALGYDLYCRVNITPAALQAGDELEYKAYVVGRGG